MIIANYIATHTDLDEVWMVVTPHNPLKQKKTLAKDYDRLDLVHKAIGDNALLRASDVEFGLPKPSYTVDTLAYLREKHPSYQFNLIMGGDNLASLHRWKNYEILLRDYQLYVYQRPAYDLGNLAEHPNVIILEAPLLQLSASYIRQCIRDGKSIQYLVPATVYRHLEKTGIYQRLLGNS